MRFNLSVESIDAGKAIIIQTPTAGGYGDPI
jgi:hypothetical protein